MSHLLAGFANELEKVADNELLYPLLGAIAMGLGGRAAGRALGRRSGASYAKKRPGLVDQWRKTEKTSRSPRILPRPPASAGAVTGARQDLGGKAGGTVGAMLGITAGGQAAGTGWGKGSIDLLKMNPNTADLNSAFAAYEKETGKSRNDMTGKEIAQYVKKIRA